MSDVAGGAPLASDQTSAGNAGDYLNVLKIKPPLCVFRQSVDYFVDALERVLATGW